MSNQFSLTPVRFYVPNDPYYYTTDNRPLEDLASRDLELMNAIQLVTGGSERSSMASASVAHSLIGYGKYAGTYQLSGGLVIRFNYGYAILEMTDVVNPALKYPQLGVHDAVTSIADMVAAPTPGRAIKYLIQAKYENPTPDSRVPSSGSDTKVCVISVKSAAEYVNDGNSEPTIIPDVNAIAIMEVIIPYGKTVLAQSDIKLLNFTSTDAIQQIVNNGPVSATDVRISTLRYEVVLEKNAQYIPLNTADCPIKLSEGTDNIGVYISGLYQHSITVEISNNRIKLGGPLPSSAEVLVTQNVPVKR